MAHQAQRRFTHLTKNLHPEYFVGKKVLDAGSLDVNGTNRFLFKDCVYIGIDIEQGKNVDCVGLIHCFMPTQQEKFDTIISTEVFEHDPYYEKSLQRLVELLKPNGLFLFTCATIGRGTHRKRTKHWNHYRNVTEQDVRKAINIDTIFRKYKFEVNKSPNDLYFWGIKKRAQIKC